MIRQRFNRLFADFSTPYEPEVIAYFSNVTDAPEFFQDATNDFVVSMKAAGLYSSLIRFNPFPYTESKTEILRDLITNTILCSFYDGGAIVSPFITRAGYASNAGMSQNSTGSGITKTGLIPSVSFTLNSTCEAIFFPSPSTAQAGFSMGAFNGATQSMAFIRRDATSNCYGDAYNNTIGAGRANQGAPNATGEKGLFVLNRQNATNFKIRLNGVTIASSTGGGGTLPTVERIFNNLS